MARLQELDQKLSAMKQQKQELIDQIHLCEIKIQRAEKLIGESRFVCFVFFLFFVFCFFLFFFVLCIDLLTDKVQPLSRGVGRGENPLDRRQQSVGGAVHASGRGHVAQCGGGGVRRGLDGGVSTDVGEGVGAESGSLVPSHFIEWGRWQKQFTSTPTVHDLGVVGRPRAGEWHFFALPYEMGRLNMENNFVFPTFFFFFFLTF
jgi:hypothetical protein